MVDWPESDKMNILSVKKEAKTVADSVMCAWDSWSANSVVGPPRVYPRYGDIHGAWAQGNTTDSEFIIVCSVSVLHQSDKSDVFEIVAVNFNDLHNSKTLHFTLHSFYDALHFSEAKTLYFWRV